MADNRRDLEWLRRQLVISIAADDDLFELLVLKGGNALALVHKIGQRTSLDLDFSLAEDPEDSEELGARLQAALTDHLEQYKIVVFDWRFEARPKEEKPDRAIVWGGYVGKFKLIDADDWARYGSDLAEVRKRAWGTTVDGGAGRKFQIDLSRAEYCAGAREEEVAEGFVVKVYTPAMIAAEKLRSLCQQMPEYAHSKKRKARSRDFFDIQAVVEEAGVDLATEEGHALLRAVFEAKQVPLQLLGLIERDVPFHEGEWSSVEGMIPADRCKDFEFYATFVVEQVRRLEPLWVEDAP